MKFVQTQFSYCWILSRCKIILFKVGTNLETFPRTIAKGNLAEAIEMDNDVGSISLVEVNAI